MPKFAATFISTALVLSGCYQSGKVLSLDAGPDAGHVDVDDAGFDAGHLPASTCGDGVLEHAAIPPEYCDDGNLFDGDGCDSNCTRPCDPPAPVFCPDRIDDECVLTVCEDYDDRYLCAVRRRAVGTPCSSGAGCVGGVCTIE